jgi:hypothetical protein
LTPEGELLVRKVLPVHKGRKEFKANPDQLEQQGQPAQRVQPDQPEPLAHKVHKA